MNHFDEMTCLLYLDRQLDPQRARELMAHVSECSECRALLGALERESRWLRESLVEEDEAVPARLFEAPARAPAPWGWLITLGFGAAGAYTLWSGLVEPMRQQLNLVGFGGGNVLTMLLFQGAFWKGWDVMRSLIEFVAIISVGLVLLALLRRNWRRWTTVGVVLSAFACALALPPAAGAAEIHHEERTYTLPSGKTVNDDLVVAAQAVNVEGTVDGDLIVFSESVRVSGHVTGDVLAFCKDIHITGQVDGNLRLSVRDLVFEGQVGKNATIFVETAEFDSKSQIGRNLYLSGGLATLDGRVARDVMAFAGRTQLNGYVGGNFKLRGHHLTIGSSTEVHGKAMYRGNFNPQVDPGAKLASPLEVEIIHERPEYATPRYYWHQILSWGAGFLFGLVLLLLMPRFFTEVVHSGDRFGPSLGIGALVLIVTPIAAIIACITLVGLAVGIGTLLLYVIALYSAKCFVGAWLGEKILGVSAGTGPMIGRLALGLLLICIARNLPYLGPWIVSIVLTWGLGALAITLYRRMKLLQAATAAPAAV